VIGAQVGARRNCGGKTFTHPLLNGTQIGVVRRTAKNGKDEGKQIPPPGHRVGHQKRPVPPATYYWMPATPPPWPAYEGLSSLHLAIPALDARRSEAVNAIGAACTGSGLWLLRHDGPRGGQHPVRDGQRTLSRHRHAARDWSRNQDGPAGPKQALSRSPTPFIRPHQNG
jgi:hypothetical protein